MTLPVATLIRPADLFGQLNGQLSASLLRDVRDGSQVDHLHHLAARAWVALVAEAEGSGIRLRFTDCYRPLHDQQTLFLQRYSPNEIPGRPSKWWRGQQWWLRPGVAVAAVPGTSNHGWGLAVDASEENDNDPLDDPLSARTLTWMRNHIARFGWSWELQSEPWHIRYVAGDNVPAAVLEHEIGAKPPLINPPPPITPPLSGDDDMAAIDVTIGPLDEHGNGWALVPSVPWDKFRSCEAIVAPPSNGMFPGYHRVDARPFEQGGVTGIAVTGWFARQSVLVRVVHAP